MVRRQFRQRDPKNISQLSHPRIFKRHTAKPTGAPLPAGLAIPAPGASAAATPPGALAPRRAEASAGGGDSTERETIWAPRTMVRPSVRFSSDSTRGAEALLAPGAAADLAAFRLTRLNSSVSARTRFMCYHTVSFGQQSYSPL